MTNGLSLEAEQLTAHLMILGWWPCEWTFSWATRYSRRQRWVGVRSQTQVVSIRYGQINLGPLTGEEIFTDIEWWQVTDEAIKKIAYTLDNTLMGW